jgi:hypothetical protein
MELLVCWGCVCGVWMHCSCALRTSMGLTPRQEPYAVILRVRIYAGGAGGSLCSYRN